MAQVVFLIFFFEIDPHLNVVEIWCDNKKWKYNEKAKLYYMDIDNFITHIKTEDIYKDIAKDVGERFDTSKYELKISLLKVKKTKNLFV